MNIRRGFSIVLAAALQVLPLSRAIVAVAPATGSSYAIIATWLAGAAALMGGTDAVSGASTVITSPTTATATNGVPFSYRITTGPEVANTFAATPLPPNLTINTSSGRITGTPTVDGVFVIHLTASDNNLASRTVTADLTLTILPPVSTGTPPTITKQPVSQTVTEGANVGFGVTASGTAPLGYQWRRDGVDLFGANSATLSLTAVVLSQAGGYSCVVSNAAGSVTSSTATLTVNAAVVAPTITSQPVDQSVTVGGNVSFAVTASGTAPLSYQWRKDGVNVAGANSATLALTSVTTGQAGSYSCVVSNVAGSVTSSAANLTVNVPPSITTQPSSQTVTEGANVSFSVVASGTAPLSYQWRKDGVNVAGANSATLTLSGVTLSQAGSYSCVVGNVAGSLSSSLATLTVNAVVVAPSFTLQPTSQTVDVGGSVSFIVACAGSNPISYQWRFNGTNIAGATSSLLSLANVTALQSGAYDCVASNAAGVKTSSVAILTVSVPVSPSLFTLVVNGARGWVTPNLNGQHLTIGKVYTVTAYADYGYVFKGWSRNGQPLSSSAMISFVMTSNLTLQVNFAVDPKFAAAGNYNGLFCGSSQVALDTAGSFAIRLDNTGFYSAWVLLQGARLPFSGYVDENFNASSSIARQNGSPLTISFTIGQGVLAGEINGTISDGNWTTALAGGRSAAVTTQAGEYTVVINGVLGNPSLPAGYGYGTLHVAADGLGTLSGVLADGVQFSQSAYVTQDGDWPMHVPIYSGSGMIISWLQFSNMSNADLAGDSVWIKPTGASATSYPSGFTNSVKVVGSKYLAPTGGSRAVNLTSASVEFAGGDLASPFSLPVSINADSQVINLSPNQMNFIISRTLGSFSGTVTPQGHSTAQPFGGVILQKQNTGFGMTFGAPNSSAVALGAP